MGQGRGVAAPAFWPAYVTLAYIRYNQMNFQAAVRLASQVLEQGKNSVDTSNKVRALLIVGGARGMLAYYGGLFSKIVNGTQIMRNIKKAQSLQPQSAAVMFGLGSYYLLAPGFAGGDKEEAEKYLLKTLELDPLFADACVRLAQLYKARHDMAKYAFYLAKAREIDPDNELAADIDSGRCKFVCLD
jgi:tetratricopeptide (TPR) repeat protein